MKKHLLNFWFGFKFLSAIMFFIGAVVGGATGLTSLADISPRAVLGGIVLAIVLLCCYGIGWAFR